MAQANWRIEGEWIKNCNCAIACPCDFNARPSNGKCKGLVGMQITKGNFENTSLDGLSFFVSIHLPDASHDGVDPAQPIIDERATPAQRQALFAILSGRNSAEGTLFNIFRLIVSKMHKPIIAPVILEFDKNARSARINIPGGLETDAEPIKKPVAGAPAPYSDRHAGRFRAD